MNKTRKRKPTKMQRQLIEQVKAVLPATIAQMETPEQAKQLEKHIWNFRKTGFISDQEYHEYLLSIKEVCKSHNWAMPTE